MYKSLFSFYGSKSRLAHLYPEPKHDQIIEPFCGGASYSLRYYRHEIWINDVDERIKAIWEFLLQSDSLKMCRELLPSTVEPGLKITELLPNGSPVGLVYLLQSEANQGTQGAKGVHNQITSMGAKCWHRILPKLEHWLPRIAHWKFTSLDYRELPNCFATWFIDPPYKNLAGSRYRHQIEDYNQLRNWCLSRQGQVIVCENMGATWLPFVPLTERRGIRSHYQRSHAMEVYWTNV